MRSLIIIAATVAIAHGQADLTNTVWRPSLDNTTNHNADWNEVLTSIDPNAWANMGVAFGLGLSVIGAAWGIFACGSSILGASIKAPRIRSKNLIRSASPSSPSLLPYPPLLCLQRHFLRGDCDLRRHYCNHSLGEGACFALSCGPHETDAVYSIRSSRKLRARASTPAKSTNGPKNTLLATQSLLLGLPWAPLTLEVGLL
jgi:F0F1-type ATP synthase membrane subunit c/vacuolar-type H+-ATPase subunit K